MRGRGLTATGENPTTLVCFLGGITYAEIAAIRFLNRQLPGTSFFSLVSSQIP